MFTQELAAYGYLIAAICFIMALRGLSSPTTSRGGNLYGIVGMVIAIGVTVLSPGVVSPWLILAGLIIGGAIGTFVALRIQMTALPQLVGRLPLAGRSRGGVRGGSGLPHAGSLRPRRRGQDQGAEPDRDGAGHRDRRHHLHRLHRGLRQAAGPGLGLAAGLQGPASAERAPRHCAGRAAGVVRHARATPRPSCC
jgi:hypothetical protein